jgi:hypothetical protein
VQNVSNPAAFGVEWSAGENRYQLVNQRGTSSLLFGSCVGGIWNSTPVVDPERFGELPPKTFAQFRAIAETFVGKAW